MNRPLALSPLLALAWLAPPAAAQGTCSAQTVYQEDFGGGVFPPGWLRGPFWTLSSSAPCASTCPAGPYAFYGDSIVCSCDGSCGSGTGCLAGSFLSSPALALPGLAPGESLVLDFCYEGFLDTGTGDCHLLRIEHPGGNTDFKLGVQVFFPCPGPSFLPPFDLTPYAGQVVRLHWLCGSVDCEGKSWMIVDDVTVTRYTAGPDCNANLVPDACDLQAGTSPDCDDNGVPDECDLAAGTLTDCNNNGLPDVCEIAGGTASDCNANGLPDECELIPSLNDCNGNGILDECDIAAGTSNDFDGDGVPDECQCSNASYCVTSPNSVGPGALISLSGSTSKTLNDTFLHAVQLPPQQIGIFYMGTLKTQVPFGDGWRCVTGQVTRLLPSLPTGAAGSVSYFLDLHGPPPLGSLLAGETRDFQFWYRDPIPVGVGFNLSDAIEITFCP